MTSTTFTTFTTAFDFNANTQQSANLAVGENGALCQESASDSSLDFNGKLAELFLIMRNSSKEQIKTIIDNIRNIIDSKLLSDNVRKEFLIKLLKVVLYLREPRKGKGEKLVFYYCIEYLYELSGCYKVLAETCVSLISEFGYYKDLNHMYVLFKNLELNNFISNLYVDFLYNDYHNLSQTDSKLSLCGKWAPREGSKFDLMAKVVAYKFYDKCFPANNITHHKFSTKFKFYRQVLSSLNKKLNTVQPFMCQKHWADIEFKNVPSVAMTNLTKAFQDIKVSPFPKSKRIQPRRSVRSGRSGQFTCVDERRHDESHADYQDRQTCRENLLEHIKSGKKVNSKVTNLSDMISQYLQGAPMDVVYEAQWQSRVKEIRDELSKVTTESTTESITEFKSIFPLVDLSSSMSGSPMINAITLGLFTSTILDVDLSKPENPFSNRFMSFETNPRLVKLPRFSQFDETKEATLKEKLEIMKEWTGNGFWGGSTDIQKAIKLLLDIATTNNVDPQSMPKILAIFSDMQFDQGDASWNQTSYDELELKFKETGYEVPHIIFWNLRGDTYGYQVKASKPNSTMLSGYSTRMLDLFLLGNIDELKQENDNINNTEKETTNLCDSNTITMLEKVFTHKMFESHQEIFDKLF